MNGLPFPLATSPEGPLARRDGGGKFSRGLDAPQQSCGYFTEFFAFVEKVA